MTLFHAQGSPETELTESDCRQALESVFAQLGQPQRVIALPPDYTRVDSQAGMLTCLAHDLLGDRLDCVLPALGTHDPMTDAQLASMFPSIPKTMIRPHRWRTDVEQIGEVPADFVREATEGIYDKPWPVEVNQLIAARAARPDPLDRPGRAARGDRHGQLQQEPVRRHRRQATASTRATSSAPPTAWNA